MPPPAPQIWEREEIDEPDELVLEPWVTDGLEKQVHRHTRSKDERVRKGKPVDVQVMGMVWDLNFSMKAGGTAKYDITVVFIRRGDKNALGELIHLFKPRQCIPTTLTAYTKMTCRGQMLQVQNSQRHIKAGSLIKNTNFCSLSTGNLVLLHTQEENQLREYELSSLVTEAPTNIRKRHRSDKENVGVLSTWTAAEDEQGSAERTCRRAQGTYPYQSGCNGEFTLRKRARTHSFSGKYDEEDITVTGKGGGSEE
ncbi:hypothetical protein C8T65DRAFT_744898 [Cerioporus squamosus]|nr:hypothetical protein C8T65DRAFT_744898 [Cerioporus squamosus]